MFLTVGVIGGADIIIPMNMRLLGQAVLQALGLISATIKYRNRLINCIDNYVPKVKYALPFDDEWYVANGGGTKNTSHFYSCIGLPIMFSDILMQVYGEYSKVDERPFPQKEDIAVGYIHRGLLVNNMEKE